MNARTIPTAFLLLASLFLPPAARAQAPEPVVQVTAGGKPLELHEFNQGVFGLFEVSGAVDVEIRTPFDVRWVDIRPRSSGILPIIGSDHKSVRFQMASPLPVTVEFNDDLARVLHLFAYAPEKDPPKPGAPNVHYFGPGAHEAGQIELKDGETLYLAPGAWVKGFVRSVGTRDIVIRGRGVLDGSSIPEGTGMSAATPARQVSSPTSAGSTRSSPERAAEYGMGNHNMIFLEGTQGAKIEGITLFNSTGWTVCVTRTHGTRINGIRILNPSPNYGDDGIDIVSSTDMLVENAFVRANDDCVAVKNLDDVETHDITVRRCVLWNMPTGGNALEIGFETGHTKISRVRFEDIDIIHVQRGSAISIHNGDSAAVEDVAYDNIRVEDARRKLIDFAILYSQYGFDRPPSQEERLSRMDAGGVWDGAEQFTPEERPVLARFRGHIRNVWVTNLDVVEGALPYSIVAGFDDDHAIEDVVITGLKYQGRPIRKASDGKFVIDHAPGFEIR